MNVVTCLKMEYAVCFAVVNSVLHLRLLSAQLRRRRHNTSYKVDVSRKAQFRWRYSSQPAQNRAGRCDSATAPTNLADPSRGATEIAVSLSENRAM